MTKTTSWAIACTLLLLAGGIFYFVKDEPVPPPPVAQQATNDPAANIIFSGSNIVEQQDGKKLWEMTAETVEVNPNTNQASLSNFKGTLYRDNGVTITVVARSAKLDTKTKDIYLEGDIKATSSDGVVFTAPLARWAGKDQRFFGSGGITLTREDTVVTGDRIESDGNLEKVTVQGNARAVKGGTKP